MKMDTGGEHAAITWPSLREILDVPADLTGKGIRIAVVDGTFTGHPDVATNAARHTYLVMAAAPDPRPERLAPSAGPWTGSAQHGTSAAAAAAGTGRLAGAEPHYSSRGTTFEGTLVPEVLAPADNLVLPLLGDSAHQQRLYRGPEVGTIPDGYVRTEGVSFAGPAVLGAAACLWPAHPEWTANQVRAAPRASARYRPQWETLRAGLVSVATAAAFVPPASPPSTPTTEAERTTAYARYRSWRERPLEDRLAALSSRDEAELLDALLSFLPDAAPELSEPAIAAIRALLRDNAHLRAAPESGEQAASYGQAHCACWLHARAG
ncbi:MAG: S8 family serine peptidase [Chloroflexi bacterium]|nr:S8 family serine peptidase [Chloroflexota bacterium]